MERNALRARLVRRAGNWRWSSLWRREQADPKLRVWLSDWPVDRPHNWPERVNAAESAAELEQLRISVARGRPFGDPAWIKRAVAKLGLESSVRPRGRPGNSKDEKKQVNPAHD